MKMIIEDDLVPEVYKSKMYDECKAKYDRAMGEYNEANESDWEKSRYGANLEQFGITTYLTNTTYYGDWSCTTFNSDTNEKLGKFCADTGMVGVFLLDEVKKYNPEFDLYETKPWTTTLIKGFKGKIDFVTVDIHEDSGFAGQSWTGTELRIEGYGNINFITE